MIRRNAKRSHNDQPLVRRAGKSGGNAILSVETTWLKPEGQIMPLEARNDLLQETLCILPNGDTYTSLPALKMGQGGSASDIGHKS